MFKEDRSIQIKNYPDNYIVGRDVCCFVIIITYDEYTFSANDGIQKVWTQIEDTFHNLEEEAKVL